MALPGFGLHPSRATSKGFGPYLSQEIGASSFVLRTATLTTWISSITIRRKQSCP